MSSIQLLTKERMESALLKMDFCSKPKGTYSSALHSHTVLKKVCPCRRYRQLNWVLQPSHHIPNLSTTKH